MKKVLFLALIASLMLTTVGCSDSSDDSRRLTSTSNAIVAGSTESQDQDSQLGGHPIGQTEKSESSSADSESSSQESQIEESQTGLAGGLGSAIEDLVGDEPSVKDGTGSSIDPTHRFNEADESQGSAVGETGDDELMDPLAGYKSYYGYVIQTLEDGSIEVAGYEHREWDNPSVRFLISDETVFVGGGSESIKVGSFVKIRHNNVMTRSLPPQCFAAEICTVPEDMFVLNCEVVEAPVKDGDNFSVLVASLDDARDQKILVYSKDTEVNVVGDLLVGAKLSVLTQGIATMSLPPQYPVEGIYEYKG